MDTLISNYRSYLNRDGIVKIIKNIKKELDLKENKLKGKPSQIVITDNNGNSVLANKREVLNKAYREKYDYKIKPLIPKEIYDETRPESWMKMPPDDYIKDNEIYILVEIPIDNTATTIKFNVTCTGQYNIKIGYFNTNKNIFFEEIEKEELLDSNSTYSIDLQADSFTSKGFPIVDGMKQIMFNVSGADITRWLPDNESPILEIKLRASKGSRLICGNNTGDKILKKLRYFTWLGTNNIENLNYMFYGCKSLIVAILDTSKGTNSHYMFYDCISLKAFPYINIKNMTNVEKMFYGCKSINNIYKINLTNITNLDSLFYGCETLLKNPLTVNTDKLIYMNNTFFNNKFILYVDNINTSNVIEFNSTFSDCSALKHVNINTNSCLTMNATFYNCISLLDIQGLNTHLVTRLDSTFYNCWSLKEIILDFYSLTFVNELFVGCRNLTNIYISNINNTIKNKIPDIINECPANIESITLTFQQEVTSEDITSILERIEKDTIITVL